MTTGEVKRNFSDAPVNWFQFRQLGRRKKQESGEIENLAHVVRRADATERKCEYLSGIVPVQPLRPADAQMLFAIHGNRQDHRAQTQLPLDCELFVARRVHVFGGPVTQRGTFDVARASEIERGVRSRLCVTSLMTSLARLRTSTRMTSHRRNASVMRSKSDNGKSRGARRRLSQRRSGAADSHRRRFIAHPERTDTVVLTLPRRLDGESAHLSPRQSTDHDR